MNGDNTERAPYPTSNKRAEKGCRAEGITFHRCARLQEVFVKRIDSANLDHVENVAALASFPQNSPFTKPGK